MAARGSARILLSVLLILPAVILWVRSEDVIAHWAPSGELFLKSGNGEIVRFEMIDGDGLSPLRYSNANPGAPCTAPTCTYPVVGNGVTDGAATFYRDGDAVPAVELRLDDLHLRLDWADVITSGGITIKSGQKGPKRLTAPECGKRPWRACN